MISKSESQAQITQKSPYQKLKNWNSGDRLISDDDGNDGDDGEGDGAHVPNRSCINYLYAICKRRAPSWRLRPLIII